MSGAPLPLNTIEIGTSAGAGGFRLYITDANGRKICAVWGPAAEKCDTAAMIVEATSSHRAWIAYADKLEDVLRTIMGTSKDTLMRMHAEQGLRLVSERPAHSASAKEIEIPQ